LSFKFLQPLTPLYDYYNHVLIIFGEKKERKDGMNLKIIWQNAGAGGRRHVPLINRLNGIV
jgi:hypothetical protein